MPLIPTFFMVPKECSPQWHLAPGDRVPIPSNAQEILSWTTMLQMQRVLYNLMVLIILPQMKTSPQMKSLLQKNAQLVIQKESTSMLNQHKCNTIQVPGWTFLRLLRTAITCISILLLPTCVQNATWIHFKMCMIVSLR
jgi:hypothetical protein